MTEIKQTFLKYQGSNKENCFHEKIDDMWTVCGISMTQTNTMSLDPPLTADLQTDTTSKLSPGAPLSLEQSLQAGKQHNEGRNEH